MSLSSRWRSMNTLRRFSVLFVAFTACAVPACGSDGGEETPPVTDSGDDASDTSSSDSADTSVDETAADASDDVSDSGSEVLDDASETGADADAPDTNDTASDTADAGDGSADATDDVADTADTGTVEIDSGVDTGTDTGIDTGTPDTAPVVPINKLSLGEGHTCGLKSDGSVYCWGVDDKGQLGDGTSYGTGRSAPSTPVMDQSSGSLVQLAGAAEVIAADGFSCARMTAGDVKCWGYHYNGALGDGRTNTTTGTSPYAVPAAVTTVGITDATHLAGSAAANFACAVLGDTSVKCWGYNGGGQVGNGAKSSPTATSVTPLRVGTPVPVYIDGATSGTKLTGVTQISANYWTVCATLSDKTARCWGSNTYANIGMGKSGQSTADGGDGPEFGERLRPTSPTGLIDVAEMRVGTYHTCARHDDGTVSCWGRNNYGEVGDGGAIGAKVVRKTPVKLTAISGVSQLALGSGFTCARLATGSVSCWGRNNIGQLGNGTTTDSLTPTTVTGITDAVEIWATSSSACARLAGGGLKCWGTDAKGELGRGTIFNVATPTRNPGLTGVTQVAVGRSANPAHACAVLSDKSLKCWGSGALGQLGDPAFNNSFAPIAVSGMTAVEEIGLGYQTTCARLTGGSVSCWGNAQYGALGGGGTVVTTSAPTPVPLAVSGVTTAKQIAIGPAFGCALLADESVTCWGNNDDGQIGDGTTNDTATPITVNPLPPVSFIAAGGASAASGHACAISKLDSSLYCWGGNGSGQIGDGTVTGVRSPKKIGIGGAATKVALGAEHTCVLLADKTVTCFGENEAGQLGDATFTDRRVPTPVPGIANAIDLWAGDAYTCARLATGAIRCWGDNTYGQLADGSLSSRTTAGPGLVGLAGSSVADVSLGNRSACAELTDGSVRCWGAIQYGALGDGIGTYTTTPVTVTY